MSRKNFHDLLARYLEGKCTAEENETVEQWYKMLDDEKVGFTREELSSVENRLWTKISSQFKEIPDQPEATLPVYQFFAGKRSMVGRAAALAGFVVAISMLFFYSKQKNPDFNVAVKNESVVHFINKSATPEPIYLQDGSYVLLKPGSALTYPKHFARQKREVYLTGEGYFLISKNPARPFLVYNNNTITRVVGTSFIISSDAETHKTEVSVQTGRVIVTENIEENLIKTVLGKKAEVILTPNQKTTYNSEQQRFTTTLVAAPLPVLKHNETLNKADFVFNEAPVSTVLKALEKMYAIEIIAAKEVNEATFTGDINGMDLYSKLDLICQSIHAGYQISGTKIYINKSIN
ncbi:FecR family protein [Mucilaginibacter arboris]|uniref:DUF4974 domain-containing protein n=1 Tax=Mucilaginibacter arboris TaxID=2682090 RepID=A0A7K1SUR8_9SPHI|nr:FecR family protein [Mucilaginibacter arboris]MVN21071.1 DUF4974 domain-containing protein [Mucilaginibacter arboris]